MGITLSGLGFVSLFPILASFIQPHLGLSPQTETEPSFLEEFWKGGQGKDYLTSADPSLLDELLAASPRVRKSFADEEASDLFQFIVAKSEQYKLSPLLVLSLIDIESGFRPTAVSRRGAVGLMQLLPATAEEIANITGMPWYPGILQNPKANIELGLRYMAQLKQQFRSEEEVLTAYNIGPAALREKLALGSDVSSAYFQRVKSRMQDYRQRAPLSRGRNRFWPRPWL